MANRVEGYIFLLVMCECGISLTLTLAWSLKDGAFIWRVGSTHLTLVGRSEGF